VPRRPLLRYHGGKWRLGKWIISHFPEHRVYVEPFGGGASVLLQKPRAYAEIYNDVDGDVVNLFRVLRDPGQRRELAEAVYLTPFAREEFQGAYVPSDSPVERARNMIVRSFMGFSSGGSNIGRKTGFRGKSFRSGSSPSTDWRNYPGCLQEIAERLRGVCVENRDAFELIPSLDGAETLFYLDPPYPESTRVDYGAYAHELSDEDHVRLAETAGSLRGMAVISGYDSEMYSDLYRSWEKVKKQTYSDCGERTECLWISPAASARQKGLLWDMAGEGEGR
jgi:DNA adenine methylase